MLPFLGSDSRYSLTSGEVHTLPHGRRVGVVSVNPREVMIAFVGTDPSWTGGVALALGDSIHRGGLTMTLHSVGKNRMGRAVAEFEVIACPAQPAPTTVSTAHAGSTVHPVVQDSPA